MIRKLWLGIMLALFVSVLASSTASQATTCRRLTIWIADDPYLSHPICMDLPAPVVDVVKVTGGAGGLVDSVLPR